MRGLWIPGVSSSTSWVSAVVRTPRICVRVVCGRSETIATFAPTIWLTSVDFPTLGRPTSETNPERNAHGQPEARPRPGARRQPRCRRSGAGSTWRDAHRRDAPALDPLGAELEARGTAPLSPSSGTCPRRLNTRPPTVSHSVSGSSMPSSSLTSSIGVRAGHPQRAVGQALDRRAPRRRTRRRSRPRSPRAGPPG